VNSTGGILKIKTFTKVEKWKVAKIKKLKFIFASLHGHAARAGIFEPSRVGSQKFGIQDRILKPVVLDVPYQILS